MPSDSRQTPRPVHRSAIEIHTHTQIIYDVTNLAHRPCFFKDNIRLPLHHSAREAPKFRTQFYCDLCRFQDNMSAFCVETQDRTMVFAALKDDSVDWVNKLRTSTFQVRGGLISVCLSLHVSVQWSCAMSFHPG